MKKILFTVMAVVLSLGLMGGAFAFFSDTETSTGNTFQAWTLALDGGTGTLTVANPVAGDNGTETWTETNVGSVPGYVDLALTVTETGAGELGSYLLVHLFVQDNGDIYGTADSPQAISGIASSYDLNLLLAPSGSSDITLNWRVSDGYMPAEGDSVELTIVFALQPAP